MVACGAGVAGKALIAAVEVGAVTSACFGSWRCSAALAWPSARCSAAFSWAQTLLPGSAGLPVSVGAGSAGSVGSPGSVGPVVAGALGSVVAGAEGAVVAGVLGSVVAGADGAVVAGAVGSVVAGAEGSVVAGAVGSVVAGAVGSVVAGAVTVVAGSVVVGVGRGGGHRDAAACAGDDGCDDDGLTGGAQGTEKSGDTWHVDPPRSNRKRRLGDRRGPIFARRYLQDGKTTSWKSDIPTGATPL